MTVRRLNHVSITVADMDRSLSFWRDLVGLELSGRGTIAAPHLDAIIGFDGLRLEWAELAIPGGGMLELFRYLEPVGDEVRSRACDPGSTHLCFEVDDLDGLVDRLRAAGVPMRSVQPVTIPSGDWAGWRDIYVGDPDGVTIELSAAPR
jgi:catechol 2,3-dioxygenase-like lactoylglutathione lyase family enzyme